MMQLTSWDIAWVIIVASQATLAAYLHHPQAKALLVTIPMPFSIAFLALGKPIESTHILGSAMLLPFLMLVRYLYVQRQQHIITAIAAAVFFFCSSGALISRYLPRSEVIYYTITAAVLVLGFVLVRLLPHRDEPGHRSPMPVWIKLPLIIIGVLLLIHAKQLMRGFVTVFPLVCTVATYEARHSLWTMTRQAPVKMITSSLMMLAMHIAQPQVGIIGALIAGWVVFAIVLPLISRYKARLHGTGTMNYLQPDQQNA